MRRRLNSRVSVLLFLCYIFLTCCPELILTAIVTLQSVEIFKTHEWLPLEPTVYFNCKGENRTFLPDVKKKHVLYTFKGEESWQPLTEFPNRKCKRCGFYEKDRVKSDDVFGEWEFCPSDFTSPDGIYIHSVDKEFNATFSCRECVLLGAESKHASSSDNGGQGMHWTVVILVSVLVSTVFILGLVAAYKYWQKKRREKDQARFLKLFEDGAALLPCLPARELQAIDRSPHPSHQIDVERHARDFMEAAKKLQLYFTGLQREDQPTKAELLHKDIAIMEEELKTKTELIKKEERLIQVWRKELKDQLEKHKTELERV